MKSTSFCGVVREHREGVVARGGATGELERCRQRDRGVVIRRASHRAVGGKVSRVIVRPGDRRSLARRGRGSVRSAMIVDRAEVERVGIRRRAPRRTAGGVVDARVVLACDVRVAERLRVDLHVAHAALVERVGVRGLADVRRRGCCRTGSRCGSWRPCRSSVPLKYARDRRRLDHGRVETPRGRRRRARDAEGQSWSAMMPYSVAHGEPAFSPFVMTDLKRLPPGARVQQPVLGRRIRR